MCRNLFSVSFLKQYILDLCLGKLINTALNEFSLEACWINFVDLVHLAEFGKDRQCCLDKERVCKNSVVNAIRMRTKGPGSALYVSILFVL